MQILIEEIRKSVHRVLKDQMRVLKTKTNADATRCSSIQLQIPRKISPKFEQIIGINVM